MFGLGKAALDLIGNRMRFSYYFPDGGTGRRTLPSAPRLWRQNNGETRSNSKTLDCSDSCIRCFLDEGPKLAFERAVTILGESLRHIAAAQQTHLYLVAVRTRYPDRLAQIEPEAASVDRTVFVGWPHGTLLYGATKLAHSDAPRHRATLKTGPSSGGGDWGPLSFDDYLPQRTRHRNAK
jgi:hypothetical protein